jgi:RimJ/RimL family protein N-acetyltransferase
MVGATMPSMFKRWLRRRLENHAADIESETGDQDWERGALVRKGKLVALRTHVAANREAFQRWYADAEIAELLRHDLEPLTPAQSRSYFDTFILPSSARGLCFAIHERRGKRLIGTTALTDKTITNRGESALFRIVIGEKETWGSGYGTEATRLVVEEAFETLGLSEVRLEVFSHNARALAAYARVGFAVTGEHVEWVHRRNRELRVIEMRLTRDAYTAAGREPVSIVPNAKRRAERRRQRDERAATRAQRQAQRAAANGADQEGAVATDAPLAPAADDPREAD